MKWNFWKLCSCNQYEYLYLKSTHLFELNAFLLEVVNSWLSKFFFLCMMIRSRQFINCWLVAAITSRLIFRRLLSAMKNVFDRELASHRYIRGEKLRTPTVIFSRILNDTKLLNLWKLKGVVIYPSLEILYERVSQFQFHLFNLLQIE